MRGHWWTGAFGQQETVVNAAVDVCYGGQCGHWDGPAATSATWPIAVLGHAGADERQLRGERIHPADPLLTVVNGSFRASEAPLFRQLSNCLALFSIA
jgi:hypothetical protein